MSQNSRIVIAIAVILGVGVLSVLGVVYRGSLFTFLGLQGDAATELKDRVSVDQPEICNAAGGTIVSVDGLSVCRDTTGEVFQEQCDGVVKSISNGFVCLNETHIAVLRTFCEQDVNGQYNEENVSCEVTQPTEQQQDNIASTQILNVGDVFGPEGSPFKPVAIEGVIETPVFEVPSSQPQCQPHERVVQDGDQFGCQAVCAEGEKYEGYYGEDDRPVCTKSETVTCEKHQESVTVNGTTTCQNVCPEGQDFKGYEGSEIGPRTPICDGQITTPGSVPGSETTTTPGSTATTQTTTTTGGETKTSVKVSGEGTPTPTPTPSVSPSASPTKVATLSKTGPEGQIAVIVAALLLIVGGVVFTRSCKRA